MAMGDAVGKLWEQGPVQTPEDLKVLTGWRREPLVEAMNQFRGQSSLAVRFATFWRVLNFRDKNEALKVWRALHLKDDSTVDFMSVILPMVATSGQEYISRVTFLFSVCDFNGSGTINRSEFYIGMRSMFKGLSRLYPSFAMPSNHDLEQVTDGVFRKIDVDRSGELELEEVITFGYRNKDLRMLMLPFPVSDPRVFEELVNFMGTSSSQTQARGSQMSKADTAFTAKLALTPDRRSSKAFVPKRPPRPWKEPAVVSKPIAFMLWSVFDCLAVDKTIPREELRAFLENRARMTEVLERSYDELLEEHSVNVEGERKLKLIEGMRGYLTKPRILDSLEHKRDGELISLRGLASLCWPSVPEKDITACVKWGRQFQAYHALRELTKTQQSALTNPDYDPAMHSKDLDINADDVEALFEVLDHDSNGKMTIQELTADGHISLPQADKLMALWDRDRNKELTKGEIKSIIWGMNQVLRRQMKGLFAANNQSSFEELPD